jgi:hypothetical protein
MGRPPTGTSPSVSFRPPRPLLDRFEALLDGRKRSDALIEAMHLWVEQREQRQAPDDPES